MDNERKYSRRKFLKLAALTAAGFAVPSWACSNSAPTGTGPSEGASGGQDNSDAFRLTGPQAAFAIALGGAELPFELQNRLITQGMHSNGRFESVVETVAGLKRPETIHLMKGKLPPPKDASFLVACSDDGARWWKIAPNSGLVNRLHEGSTAVYEEVEQWKRHDGFVLPNKYKLPEQTTIVINNVTYSASETNFWGKSVQAMITENGDKKLMTQLYDDAFITASRLLTEKGITVRDPNPGNILALELEDGRMKGFIIDFESSGAKGVSPTPSAINALTGRFNRWGKELGLDLNLNLPADVAEKVLIQPFGETVGRLFIKNGFVDYAFAFEGLSSKQIAQIRNQVSDLVRSGQLENATETTVDGILVKLRKVAFSNTDDAIRELAATSGRAMEWGKAATIIGLAASTITIEGVDGMAMRVPTTYDRSVELQKFVSQITPDSLVAQANVWKEVLMAYAGSRLFVPGAEWLADISTPPEVRNMMDMVMGMSSQELTKIMREYNLDLERDVKPFLRDRLEHSMMPWPLRVQFSSDLPGIEGAKLAVPLWISYGNVEGTEVLSIWADNWKTALGVENSAPSGAEVIPLVVWNRSQGQGWQEKYMDAERAQYGFRVDMVEGVTQYQCLMTSDPNQPSLILNCKRD